MNRATQGQGQSTSETRLAQVLDDYLAAVAGGAAFDRSALLAAHPDLAEDLKACFASLDFLRAAAPGDHPGFDSSPPDEGFAAEPLGEFRIVREIGRGGMGVVYEAQQSRPARRVALKVVLAGRFAPADDLRRFRIEAEAAAQLDHPNIVPIFEVGEQAGLPFFSMKLLEGGSLADRLAAPCEDPKASARLVATIARAVQHAHERGILHRDLKPANVLLDVEGRPYIADFGLAKRLESHDDATRTGDFLGSPPYMAPEQVAGEKRAITIATDVYGLGAILYALVTGRPPFRGDSAVETIERVKAGNPDLPSRINRAIGADLEAICLKCLEQDSHRRYRSAAELADDLDRWLGGAPTVARPLSRAMRLGRWAWRRRRGLATVAGAVVALGLIGRGALQTERLRQARTLARQHGEAIRRRDQEARETAYLADIRAAAWMIDRGMCEKARSALDRHLPPSGGNDIRGFEWNYLSRVFAAYSDSWVAHEGQMVYHVEYAPDGRTLATAGGDKTARVWDAQTRRERVVLRGHESDVNWVSSDPDGRRLVTAGDDASARVWDAADGRVLNVLRGFKGPVIAALFTRDGRDVIGAARDGTIVRWDAATGARRAELAPSASKMSVESLALSPQGTTLAYGNNSDAFHLLDLSHGGLDPIGRSVAAKQTNGLALAFTPDGRSAIASQHGSRFATIWDLGSDEPRSGLEGRGCATYSLALSADGRTLVTADLNGVLRLWDLTTPSVHVTLQGHDAQIWWIALSPDGQTLASASRDGTVRLWDCDRASDRAVFHGLVRERSRSQAASLAFSNDGRRVVAATRAGDVLECDLLARTARLVGAGDPRREDVHSSLSPDGTMLALHGHPAPSDDLPSSVLVEDLSAQRRTTITLPVQPARTMPLLWSRDGKRLAVVGHNGDLTLWDASDGRNLGRAPFGFPFGSSTPVFLPAGDALGAFVGQGYPTHVPLEFVTWSPGLGRLDRRPKPGSRSFSDMGKLVVAPDGRSLACAESLVVWDFTTLEPRYHMIGHDQTPTDLVYSPDGRTIATTSLDHTVRLWSVASGQELLTLKGHRGPVRAVTFSHDGRALATCGDHPEGGIEVIVWRADARARGDPAAPRARRP